MAVTYVGAPVAQISNLTGATIAFTAFSPNAGSSYVVGFAVPSTGTSPGSNMTPSWSAGGSGTWSQLSTFQVNIFQPRVSIWYCNCTSAPGSSTVTLTTNGQCTRMVAYIAEITGDATVSTLGASVTSSAAANSLSITPQQTGSLIFHMADDLNEGFTPTANAASSVLGFLSSGGQVGYGVRSSANTTATVAVAVGITNTCTANIQLASEIKPAAVAAPINLTMAPITGF